MMILTRARAVFCTAAILNLTTVAVVAPEAPKPVEPLTFERQAQLRDFVIERYASRG